jgi:hypothetical protein
MPRIKSFETWICEKPRDKSVDYYAQGHRFADLGRVVVLKITDRNVRTAESHLVARRECE